MIVGLKDIVLQTEIDGMENNSKRTERMINPAMATCTRSNHDVKIVTNDKDSNNIASYVTNYTTKAQMSCHYMIPLIVASEK